jgi:FKBP-type peptidyl-prolyl cis-trans isomerase FkpA
MQRNMWLAVLSLAGLCITLVGCSDDAASRHSAARMEELAKGATARFEKDKSTEPEEKGRKDAGDSTEKKEKKVITTKSGLKYEDLKVGSGEPAKAGDTVEVHYTGWLKDGTKFDSSHDRGKPFSFELGIGNVIKGWDEGVAGMKAGGKRKLMIPPDLGYGKRGSPPAIPPDSELIFEVELLKIK